MKKYWATEPEEKIGKLIIERHLSWLKYLRDRGIIKQIRKSFKAYYGNTEIESIGNGLQAIHVNNYASLIRNLHVMVTSSRPAWQPRAVNSDLDSQASVELGSSLLDYYMREKHLEKKLNMATEMALVLREGWVVGNWDVNAGEVIRVVEEEDGKNSPIFEGDVSYGNYNMLDVARDIYKKSNSNHKWHIVKDYKNKYDLAETYPQLAEKILALTSEDASMGEYVLDPWNVNQDNYCESDIIPIYTLYHDKSPSIPDGRLTVVASDEVILFDGPLPYKRPYIFSISTTDVYDSPIGHSNTFDLLPLQDALNSTMSAILTNQAANAVQNFQMPEGAAIKVSQVADGLRVIKYDPKVGGLAPLDLLKTSPEVFKFSDTINQWMQLLINVSSITRGEAPASMSGTAMALLQQQSLQFNSNLQLAHTQLLENVGTSLIELLQTFAEEPRLAIIVGKTNQSYMKRFSSENLKGISRVIVDSANPLTKTTAGRVEIANQLLSRPEFIKTPDQYLSVLTTGNLEPLYEFDRSRQRLIKSENEAMMRGEEVPVIFTDDHPVHALEHACLLDNPEARKNPDLIALVSNHIQQHLDQAKTMPPELAAMLKQTSFFNQPQPPPPAGGPININPDLMNQAPPQMQFEEAAAGARIPQPAQPPQI